MLILSEIKRIPVGLFLAGSPQDNAFTMSNNKTKCRWGFLGAAGIARKNWQSIKHSGNAELVAVASRKIESAEKFIAECQSQVPMPITPRAVEGYEALLASDDIDAVYIPLPTGLRQEYVLKAARAGKHVLCEKPSGVDAADVQTQIDACEKAGVQWMDGVMFMHSQRLTNLRNTLNQKNKVGNIIRIASQFSFMAPEDFGGDIRMNANLEPFGSLGDLGWYCIRMILWTLNYEMPSAVTGRMISETHPDDGTQSNPASIPLQISAELIFPSGVTASLYCSFETENQQWIHISGSKGQVMLEDFVLPYHRPHLDFTLNQPVFKTDGCQFHMEKHEQKITTDEYSDSHANAQETLLFRTFSELVLSGKTDSHWPEIALKTQQVMDAILTSARNGGREVSL